MTIKFQIQNNLTLQRRCINCQQDRVIATNSKDGREQFTCSGCNKTTDRAIIIDPSIKWWIDDKKVYWHQSVGAILINSEGKILLFERTRFPIATVFPAGHVDAREKPVDTFIREVKEETSISLKPNQAILIAHDIINNDSCRRGSDDHEWWVYAAYVSNPTVTVNRNEGINPEWEFLDEINTSNLPPAAKKILEKYSETIRKIIKEQSSGN